MARDYAENKASKDISLLSLAHGTSKHQYDFDAATPLYFIKEYGLEKDFKLNIEVNHATLAQHTFQHELQVAANGSFGKY